NPELLKKMVRLYLDICPRWLEEMRTALAGADARRLSDVAHTLKGSASHFGARGVVEAAQALEALGRAGNLASADAAFVALEEAVRQLEPALLRLVEDASPATLAQQ